jgi:hypothetical protein
VGTDYCYVNYDLKQYFSVGLFGTNARGDAVGRTESARALAWLISDQGTWRQNRIAVVGDASDEIRHIIQDFVDIEIEAELMLLDIDGLESVESALAIQPDSTFLHLCELAIHLRRPHLTTMLCDRFGKDWQDRYLQQMRTEVKRDPTFRTWHVQKVIDAKHRSLRIFG